jgi:hypothetical protein
MTTAASKRPDRSKKERVPLGARNRLGFRNLDKRFHYHLINDQDDRLARAQEAGYEFVESDEKMGDTRVAEGTTLGSRVSKPVGNDTTGYLMRIPMKFYNEDQAAKEANLVEKEEDMQPKTTDGQYGAGVTAS